MATTTAGRKQQKTLIRTQGHERRRALEDKDSISSQIVTRFLALPEYEEARTVMFYVDVRAEVRTRFALPAAIASDKRIVVPYCVDGILDIDQMTGVNQHRVVVPLTVPDLLHDPGQDEVRHRHHQAGR